MQKEVEPTVRVEEFHRGEMHFVHFRRAGREWFRVDDRLLHESHSLTKRQFFRAREFATVAAISEL
jgi:hypothetical protein